MIKRLLAAVAAVVLASSPGLVTPTPVAAAGRTLYVSTTGRDFNPDGWSTPPNSIATPWLTIQRTMRRALPGDTIVVRGGTYTEIAGWGIVPATGSAPIRVQNYPGERVVLKGVLQMDNADYWIVRGINVTRDPALGRKEMLVKFAGGTGWQFLDAEVWGTNGVSNVMVTRSTNHGAPSNYRIAGNCIHDNNAVGDPVQNDHNLYLMPGFDAGPGLIERNIFFNAENGAHIKAAGSSSSTGAANVTIRYNTMVRGRVGIVVAYGSHHNTMTRNLIGAQAALDTPPYSIAIRGYRITGQANASSSVAVWGYRLSVASEDSTYPIRSSNVARVNPGFDSTLRCSGFHPSDATARTFGRYAP
jgi:hypothetical protein